jgi:hypothetical protein
MAYLVMDNLKKLQPIEEEDLWEEKIKKMKK